MMPAGGRSGEGPKAPEPAFWKAMEAVVAAGKRGLLGPAALAATARVPEQSRPGSSSSNAGGVSQEAPPGPVPQEAARAANATLPGSPKEIWICGNSVVLAARKKAGMNSHGLQLGIPASRANVYWHGMFAMKWEDLLLVLQDVYQSRSSPSVLIIHLGEDDLLPIDNFLLLMSMKNDLDILRKAFPDTVIIWSSLLPSCSPMTLEETEHEGRALEDVNTRMLDYCIEIGVHFLSHNFKLLLPNLTELKIADMFIADVQKVLQLYEVSG